MNGHRGPVCCRSEERAREQRAEEKRAEAAWLLRLIGGLRGLVVVVRLVAAAGVRFEIQLDRSEPSSCRGRFVACFLEGETTDLGAD